MYATVADLRAEGVTEAMAADTRLAALIEEAGASIDRITGWFFEPRSQTFVLDGRGCPTLELPVPPIQIARISVGDTDLSLSPEDLLIVGAPIHAGFDAPRITRRHHRSFPHGRGNVVIEGLWGFTEPDGTTEGRTPLEIRRACMLLVLRLLYPLAGEDSADARQRWRILEEKTRDQSYRLDGVKEIGPFTGDPEIDHLLLRYRRPPGQGAA
jgi:hypothetical protein